MSLLDRYKMPPGGFYYREPSIGWVTSNPYLPFDMVAREIQSVRVANLKAGLNPDIEACAEALDTFTCQRLNNDPKWCSQGSTLVAQTTAASRKKKTGCGSCGSKRSK